MRRRQVRTCMTHERETGEDSMAALHHVWPAAVGSGIAPHCCLFVFSCATHCPVLSTAQASLQPAHLLPRRLAMLAAQHKGGGGSVDAICSGTPVAAQARQGKHHFLLVGHGRMVHRGACRSGESDRVGRVEGGSGCDRGRACLLGS